MSLKDLFDEVKGEAEKLTQEPVEKEDEEKDKELEEKYFEETAQVVETIINRPRTLPGRCGQCGGKLTPSGCGCQTEECTNHVSKWPKRGAFQS